MYTFNREIIEQAREKIKQAYSCYEEVWDKSSQNSVKNLVNLLDDTGEFQSFKKGIGESTKQLMAPVSYTHLDVYKRQADAQCDYFGIGHPGRIRIPSLTSLAFRASLTAPVYVFTS